MVRVNETKRKALRKFFKEEKLFNKVQIELFLQFGKRQDKTYFNAVKKLLDQTTDLYLKNLGNKKGKLYLRMMNLTIDELKFLKSKF